MLKYLLLFFSFVVLSAETFAQNTLSYTDKETDYLSGLEHFEKKNFGAAIQEFQNFLAKTDAAPPENEFKRGFADYYITLSAMYLNYPEAELLAERFIKAHPDHPQAGMLYFRMALYHFNREDFNKAAILFEKVNLGLLSPEQALEAKFKLGMAYYNQQNTNKALDIFNLIKQTQGEYAEAASYYAGHIELRNENYEAAVQDFRRIENTENYKSEVPGLIAHIYYKQKKFSDLLAYTEPLLKNAKSGKKLDELALVTAEVYFFKNDYVKAAEYYKQYINYKKAALPPDVQYRYGVSMVRTNDSKRAIEALRPLATRKDTLGQYSSYYLGISYLKNENANSALSAFDIARKQNFNRVVKEESAFNYGKVLFDLNRGTEAIKELNDFLKTYPTSKYENDANEIISEAYLFANNYQAAMAYIEGLRNKTPKIKVAYQRMAYSQAVNEYNADAYEAAIRNFDKSLANNVSEEITQSATFWKAEAKSAQQKYNEAIPLYNQVLANKNDENNYALKSNYALGYAFYNQKEYDKALLQFKNYVAQLKNAPNKLNVDDAILRMADCYLVQKNYAEAEKLYAQAANIAKTDKDYAAYQRGMMLILQEKTTEAKGVLDRLVNQFPNSRYADDALFQLGMIDFNANVYQVAIRQFSRLLQEKPKSPLVPSTLLKRATSYSNIKQYEESLADYKIILEKYPKDKNADEALAGIQDVLNTLGRSDEFSEIVANYKKANPDDKSLEGVEFETAKNLYFNEKFDKAILAFIEYMKNYPASGNNTDAKYFLADAYSRSNDKANALRYFYLVVSEAKSQFTNKAAQRAAEIEFAQANYKGAIRNYQALTSFAKNKRETVTAWLGLMESYFNITKYDSTQYFAKEIINGGSVVAGASNKALLYNAKAVLAKTKDTKMAIDEFQKVIDAAKDEYGAEAQYAIAEIYYKSKKYEEVKKICLNYYEQFPNYEKWIDKNFLLLADAYIDTQDYLNARSTLDSIIEGATNSETKKIAQDKLKKIEGK